MVCQNDGAGGLGDVGCELSVVEHTFEKSTFFRVIGNVLGFTTASNTSLEMKFT